ncbi:MAG: dihydrolipoamide acetyltransferase, partial [Alcaligenaceae bacterium]|nr:dihydrolipoamide acetyltransferase [Alcaligenaceae bacterium]
MSNIIEIKVPDIGDVAEVDVIEVLVAEGDTVTQEQSLITVESDKASMEIPSTAAGVVKLLKVKVGDKVSEGSVILELAGADAKAAAQPAAAPAAPAAAGKAERATVVVPDIGDATDVEVIEIMVSVGDQVEPEQSLITVESDKASMEVPSSHGGVVKEVRVNLGDKVNQGSEIVILEGA